ncbi:hypothetical protein ACFFJT_00480 [Dyella flava]|uniref:Uncharacterized protein n=1 Tax=Dyella flava TaxID=1920170 RepID=A0ABS2JZI9_9GAMM|nr:hypothetical protein [Dyella flava]MBM7124205.1 hypothetical protein [Dyella flava]GLQ50517.1 hypothetical protein GCM10010872_19660 [Dyella flava]
MDKHSLTIRGNMSRAPLDIRSAGYKPQEQINHLTWLQIACGLVAWTVFLTGALALCLNASDGLAQTGVE